MALVLELYGSVLAFSTIAFLAIAWASSRDLIAIRRPCPLLQLALFNHSARAPRKDWLSVVKRACVWTSAYAEALRKNPSPQQSLRSGARVSEGPGLASSGNASVQTMSIKFNDTQLVLLSAASQRDDPCLVPPTGSKRGQAQKAIVKLLEAGIVKEIRAKVGAPIWRRDEEKGTLMVSS